MYFFQMSPYYWDLPYYPEEHSTDTHAFPALHIPSLRITVTLKLVTISQTIYIWLFVLCAPYSQIYNLQTRDVFVHTLASQCTKQHLARCQFSHTFSKEMNKNKVTKSILSQRLRQWRIDFPTCQVMFELGLCKQTEGAELKSSHTQVRERSFSTTVPALSHETQQGAWFSFSSKIIPLSASLHSEKELKQSFL